MLIFCKRSAQISVKHAENGMGGFIVNAFNSTIYKIMEWITRFAFIHLLWIVFSLSGLILLGLFPSTVALFTIIREWLRGKSDIPIFTTFWHYFKSEFVKANLFGITIIAILLLIGVDFYFILLTNNSGLSWVHIPLFALVLLLLLFLLYVFPAYVHYDINITLLIKNTILIMLVSPLHNLLMIVCLTSIFIIMRTVPALFFISGSSIYAFITMWLALQAFDRLHKKQIK